MTKGEKISLAKFKYWATHKIPRSPCKVCGKPVTKPTSKYCSKACQNADRASWAKGPPKVPRNICPTCGKETPRAGLFHCSKACLVADPRFREDHLPALLKGQKIAALPAKRKQAAARMRGRPQVAVLTAKGPAHCKASEYCLRSPEGIIFSGRNLMEFVRTHEDLFDRSDVAWRPTHPKPRGVLNLRRNSGLQCRASKGLTNLFGENKNVRHSWKGWTRVGTSALAA